MSFEKPRSEVNSARRDDDEPALKPWEGTGSEIKELWQLERAIREPWLTHARCPSLPSLHRSFAVNPPSPASRTAGPRLVTTSHPDTRVQFLIH